MIEYVQQENEQVDIENYLQPFLLVPKAPMNYSSFSNMDNPIEEINVEQEIIYSIRNSDRYVWDKLNFLRNFKPASGILGNKIFKDDAYCDKLYNEYGHCFFDNGDYYEGRFVNGKIREGVYIWRLGARYLGDFENKRRSGLGLMINEDGTYYYGEYANDFRHGYGAIWDTDYMYYGKWVKDTRQGQGFCRWSDNTYFKGNWKNDQPVRQ